MKRLQVSFVLVVVSIFAAGCLQAVEVVESIDRVMGEYAELDLFSGTVLVARQGDVIYAAAFGEANKDHGVANILETRFNIGSIGKTLTGTAIMQLVEAGKVELEAPVTRYLPEFPYGDGITIHHLLSHTSGLSNYMAHPGFRTQMARLREIDDFLPLVYDQELRFDEPGSEFAYSNSGVVVLGLVIEKVSGLQYEEYLQKNILGPTGMTSTGINFWDEVVPNRATGYTKGLSGKFTAAVCQAPPACADGGIETTVLDLLKFDRALRGETLISNESKAKMYTPNLDNYGYTWQIRERNGRRAIFHGGGTAGVSAMFLRFLEDEVTIIVLSNYTGAAMGPARTIEAIVFGESYEPPQQPIGQAVYGALKGGGLDPAPADIGGFLEEKGYRLRSSSDLNMLGYEFLGEGEVAAAIAVFELNTQRFPDDANTWDSLGESYLSNGDREKGIAAYRKALEIDPTFDNAIQVLKRLEAGE